MSPPVRPLRILVTPLSSHGHLNACHGLCEELRDRGHEITFLLAKAFAGRLAKYGFKEHLIEPPPRSAAYDFDPDKEFWPQFMEKNANRYDATPLEQMASLKV